MGTDSGSARKTRPPPAAIRGPAAAPAAKCLIHIMTPISHTYNNTDTGTEELNHVEMICTIVHQLTRNLTVEQIKEQGFADYYVDHTTGLWPQAASGMPFSASTFQSTGDPIADLTEDLAAEQKARITYDNILRLVKDDPDVYDAIKFLRAREIVHFQRFGEGLRLVQDRLDSRNFYAFNPAFDKCANNNCKNNCGRNGRCQR